MRFILSGFGKAPETSIALYEDGRVLWSDGVEAPSFCIRGDGYVFTITENKEYAAVHAYREEADALCHTHSLTVEGGLLCHLAYSAKHGMLLGACYETGNVLCVPFDAANGTFGQAQQHWQTGDGKSRAHSVLINAAQDTVYSANIALDRIYRYRLTADGLQEDGFFSVPLGSGPRHLLLSPDEKLLYAITEYSNQILVCDLAAQQVVQAISTLPQGTQGRSNCSTLCFAGEYLYAANRFTDIVARFAVEANGLLRWLDAAPCGGANPRHMTVTPDERQLAVCCQNDHKLVLLALNADGSVGETVQEYPFFKPAGIVF